MALLTGELADLPKPRFLAGLMLPGFPSLSLIFHLKTNFSFQNIPFHIYFPWDKLPISQVVSMCLAGTKFSSPCY